MATTHGYPAYQSASGQPVFLRPGTGAVPMAPSVPANTAPGVVMYAPQGGVLMMSPLVSQDPPNYEYTPNDFYKFALFTAILCGIFSPITLAMSIPGVKFSKQSRKSAVAGRIDDARREGVCAAYLSMSAITVGLVIACVATGLTISFFFQYYRQIFNS